MKDFLEMGKLSEFYSNQEEWENFIKSFNVRKIINQFDKAWIQKIRRNYKNYGWDMNFYADQKKRLEMIKDELDNIEKK